MNWKVVVSHVLARVFSVTSVKKVGQDILGTLTWDLVGVRKKFSCNKVTTSEEKG